MNIDNYIDLILEGSNPIDLIEDLLEDFGGRGKEFEATLMQAFDLVGLEYEANRTAGALWDIKTIGNGWGRLVGNKQVNIKVAGSKWMFGSVAFTKALPWDDLGKGFDLEKAKRKIRRIVVKMGLPQVVFLKPKSREIEDQITSAVQSNDVDTVTSLLVKKNFELLKLGRHFDIRISTRENKIGSIAILDSSGKVFIRSEKPRNIGGADLTAFRVPKNVKGNIVQVKQQAM